MDDNSHLNAYVNVHYLSISYSLLFQSKWKAPDDNTIIPNVKWNLVLRLLPANTSLSGKVGTVTKPSWSQFKFGPTWVSLVLTEYNLVTFLMVKLI